jgi:hypothetical protein
MSQETYSIPAGPTARYEFQSNAIMLCAANAILWNIPETKLTGIAALRTKYELKYAVANNPGTQSTSATAARDDAWLPLATALRDLYDHHIIYNPAITAEFKEALNVHFRIGGGGSPSPAPTSTPLVKLVCEEISVLHVVYSDSQSVNTHSKPANVAFCELSYKVGDPAPSGIADCTERYNITRSHEAIVFTPEERGKKVHVFARWVNKNGKLGPWSNMVSALIP